jgi:hypothetical protein
MPDPEPEHPDAPDVETGRPVIPCSKNPAFATVLTRYIRELRQEAHGIGSHGLTAEEFKRSGLFEAAIASI